MGATSKPDSLALRFTRLPLALMVFTVLLDQGSKWLVVTTWPSVGYYSTIIPHFFSLVHFRNPGAAWGMLSRYPVLLTVLSMLVLGAAIFWFPKLTEGVPARALALGVILGGIAGNLLDRIFRHEVVDFLLFYWRRYQWPAFNVADTAISCGVAVYILSSFLHPHDADHATPEESAG